MNAVDVSVMLGVITVYPYHCLTWLLSVSVILSLSFCLCHSVCCASPTLTHASFQDIYIQLSAAEFATCGVNLDERVRCWGQHASDPPPSMAFLQVSCGSYHCCGVRHDESLHCWGMDFMGQLKFPREGKFVQVSSGLTHVCALKADGTIVCWGDDARE